MISKAVHRRAASLTLTPPKRLLVFHAFSELAPDAQAVVSDLVLWLHRWNPQSRQQLRASLDALAQRRTPVLIALLLSVCDW